MLKIVFLAFFLFSSCAKSMTVPEFASKIAQLNQCVEFSVTSWFRSDKRNKAVGGAMNSLHLKGLAVDVVLDYEYDKPFFFRKLEELGLSYIDEETHVHISGGSNVSFGNYNNARLGDVKWGNETILHEAREREAETPALHGSSGSGTGRKVRDQERSEHPYPVDTQSNSSVSGVRGVNLAQDSSTVLRYFGSLRVDRDQSGVLVFHRRSGDSEMAHASSQHNSPDPFRYPYRFGYHWAVLRQ